MKFRYSRDSRESYMALAAWYSCCLNRITAKPILACVWRPKS